MLIRILRDACCAADDQAGPLSMELELDGQAPFRHLIDSITASGFLQYSSSHTTMLGHVDRVAVVRVHSSYYSKEQTQYMIDPATTIYEALKSASIDFQFQRDANLHHY